MTEVLTLGGVVAEWITENCVVPDGMHAGEPYELTDEMCRFLDHFYAVDPQTGKFFYPRGAQLIRPQKWGKGPFSAAIICAEAMASVVPVWEGRKLKSRPWPQPWIQVTAVSEDQTVNVFSALIPMIQLGPLRRRIPDTGLGRINLPSQGWIEPVTASARSRLGQRVTFCVEDETHSWLESNGGWPLADNQRRNLAGMGGRFLETTNAFDPVERSVAQRTFEGKAPGTYLDDAEPPPGSVRNKRERRKVMQAVYGDSYWVDLDRIDAEIEALLEHDPAQAERYFLNRKLASEGAAFDAVAFRKLKQVRKVDRGETIVLGVDGARHDDAIAVVATEVRTGYQWPVVVIERPANAPDDYEHDLDQVDGAVSEMFERFQVWRAYCDPHWIEGLVEGWQNRFGEKRVIAWYTNRPRPIAWAIRNYQQAITAGDLAHDGNEVFERHVANARRRKLTVLDDRERPMHTLCKDTIQSPRKIDAAMAAVLSWEARGDCIAAGAVFMGDEPEPEPEPDHRWRPGRALPAEALVGVGEAYGPMGNLS